MLSRISYGSNSSKKSYRKSQFTRSLQKMVIFGLILFVILNCIGIVFGEIEPLPPENDDDFQDVSTIEI